MKDQRTHLFTPILQNRRKIPTSRSPIPAKSQSSLMRSVSVPRQLPLSLAARTQNTFKPSLGLSQNFSSFDSWKKAHNMSPKTKVFIIQGVYPDLKQGLIERGWAENPDPQSPYFDLFWARTGCKPAKLQDWQIINHFPNNFELSAKWNLCENLKKLKLFQGIDSDQFFPRCFRIIGKEASEFEIAFKINKAVSIIRKAIKNKGKWNEKVSVALAICKKWLNSLESNSKFDRERNGISITNTEWKIISHTGSESMAEIKKFFSFKTQAFTTNIEPKAKNVVERLKSGDPQISINGLRNLWIVKPGRKSRGREIAIFDSLEAIKKYTQNAQQWIVQKYIENPLLIEKKKFDIRQWVLISSCEPLTVWIYGACYLRFSVEDFELTNINNVFAHLTNNSIAKNSKNFETSAIKGCMWHVDQFKSYLSSVFGSDIWTAQLFPQIKAVVKWTLASIGKFDRKNTFELLGYDFMVDENMKVWLIEVNSSPAMDYSTVINI
jgi:tubulin monoglycylase TTLL3/8